MQPLQQSLLKRPHFLRNHGLHPLILCQCPQENSTEVQAQIECHIPTQNEPEAQGKEEPPATEINQREFQNPYGM